VRRLHPDVNKAPDAHEAFTRVQRAYEVLIDEPKRRAYDRLLAQQSAPAVEVVLSPHYSWTSVGGVGGVGGAGGAAPAGASGTSVGVDGDVSRAAYADIERQELGEDVDRYWSVLFEPRARARGDRSDPPGDGPRRSNPP
jgi:DnaJ-class molecular chaperone